MILSFYFNITKFLYLKKKFLIKLNSIESSNYVVDPTYTVIMQIFIGTIKIVLLNLTFCIGNMNLYRVK